MLMVRRYNSFPVQYIPSRHRRFRRSTATNRACVLYAYVLKWKIRRKSVLIEVFRRLIIIYSFPSRSTNYYLTQIMKNNIVLLTPRNHILIARIFTFLHIGRYCSLSVQYLVHGFIVIIISFFFLLIFQARYYVIL